MSDLETREHRSPRDEALFACAKAGLAAIDNEWRLDRAAPEVQARNIAAAEAALAGLPRPAGASATHWPAFKAAAVAEAARHPILGAR